MMLEDGWSACWVAAGLVVTWLVLELTPSSTWLGEALDELIGSPDYDDQ